MVEGTFTLFVVLVSIWVITLLYTDLFAPAFTAEVIPQSVSGPLIGSSQSSMRRLIDGHIRIETPPDFQVVPGRLLVLTMRRSLIPRQATVLVALNPATKQAFVSNTAIVAAASTTSAAIFGLLCFVVSLLDQTGSDLMPRAWALAVLNAVVSALYIKRHVTMAPLRSSVAAMGLRDGVGTLRRSSQRPAHDDR